MTEDTWPRAKVPLPTRNGGADFNIETLVGYLLLVGILLSLSFIIAGLSWQWAATGQLRFHSSPVGMNLFQFVWTELRQLGSGSWRPELLIKVGIAALMLTPYVRVLVSMLYFAFAERNWKYTLFTGVVFSVLTHSLFLR
jgi:uncharacterized membrane protein